MKSYLDLVGISAKIRKKQNRMTILCILLSVFLVTVILSMADEAIKCQVTQEIKSGGNWHAMCSVNEKDANLIKMRSDINTVGFCNWTAGEKNAKLEGNYSSLFITEQNIFSNVFYGSVSEGKYPSGDNEVLLTEKAKSELNIKVGDTVDITLGEKPMKVKVSGFTTNTDIFTKKDPYGIIFDESAFKTLFPNEEKQTLMIRFNDGTNMRKSITDITTAFSLSDKEMISNGNLLALLMQSDNNYVQSLYICAFVLCFIVLIAGVIMITSSLNINVSQKTEFFGMIRCLGASKKQIKRYVRLDALRYCKFAVPLGVALGVITAWGLSAALRFVSPGLFGDMPIVDISWISVIFGALIGILTVMISAMSPAKKASKVSPLTAVSGNADAEKPIKHSLSTRFFKIDTVLGVHHATGQKKNFVLMICSFALSIILFLAFSVAVDFMNHAVVPLSKDAPDIIVTAKGDSKLSKDVADKIKSINGITNVYGRAQKIGVDAEINGKAQKVTVISYDKIQFDWASGDICDGNMSSVENGENAMLIYDNKVNVNVSNTVKIGSKETKVAAKVTSSAYNPDNSEIVLIVSENTFKSLFGNVDYTILDVQQSTFANSKNAENVSSALGSGYNIIDKVKGNSDARGAYYSFAFFVYGFLIIIALITVANIVNSVAMGVNSRKKQYGFMRAVGMNDNKLLKMILSQTLTYSLVGSVVGCIPGVLLNRFLFQDMVTQHWGDAWQFPIQSVAVIVVLIIITSIIAVYNPYRQVRNMSIIKNIGSE